MEETIISWILTLLTAFWAGYSYGKRNTTINHVSNYTEEMTMVTMLASQDSLAIDWESPEDEAWNDL